MSKWAFTALTWQGNSPSTGDAMLSVVDAERMFAARFTAYTCAVISLGFTCALLYVVLTVDDDEKFGALWLLLYGVPLTLATIGASVGAAHSTIRFLGQLDGAGGGIAQGLLALIPGIGVVVVFFTSRRVTAMLQSNGLHRHACGVCGRRFVETSGTTGVCLNCLREIE